MVRCDSKNMYEKGMCSKETRLYAQYMITILGFIVNLIGGTYMAI